MKIELELRLEGQDANEETLLDLIDWLKRANIDNLVITRTKLPPSKGNMGAWTDPNTIMTSVLTVIEVGRVINAIITWQKSKPVVIEPTLKNPEQISAEYNTRIQAILEEMRKKSGRGK
jgi:hypothetical protein